MKQRIISSVPALAVLVAVAVLMNTVVYNIIIFAVLSLCFYEIALATGQKKLVGFLVLYALYAAFLTFFPSSKVLQGFYSVSMIFTMLYFTLAIAYSLKQPIENSASAYFLCVIYSAGMFAWLAIKEQFGGHGDGVFIFVMTIALPLLGDLFAYFGGRAFGKKKLCQHLSPKKTVAGAVCAVASAPFYSALCLFIYSLLPSFKGGAISAVYSPMLYLFVAALGAVVAFFGIFGDLASSAVKRKFGIKDYGNIMPGHGGAADRLDSVCFTAPLVTMAFFFITGCLA